jgi:hypothetical protein
VAEWTISNLTAEQEARARAEQAERVARLRAELEAAEREAARSEDGGRG